jgi:hypothetical protein
LGPNGKVANAWMRKCELRDLKGEIIRSNSILTQKPKADTPWDDPIILGKRPFKMTDNFVGYCTTLVLWVFLLGHT